MEFKCIHKGTYRYITPGKVYSGERRGEFAKINDDAGFCCEYPLALFYAYLTQGPAPATPDSEAMLLPSDPAARKEIPITTGVLDYFPKALGMVARCSKVGNDQHNPGQPLHWAKGKSADHADCIARHLIDRKAMDTDNVPHAVKLAWRALANLETMIENGEVKW